MSAPRRWTGIGCGLGALTVLLLVALGPAVQGPWLSFSNVVLASVALVVVGLPLRLVGPPTAQAVGGVLTGAGVAWLASVAGLLALFAASGGLQGP
ncbi:MAG TPA: hypothetical protein VF494_11075 [Candidatus Limnocylindrales bacterium]